MTPCSTAATGSASTSRGDPYRAKVLDLQSAADRVVRSTCASTGQKVIDIPPGMTTTERVRWIATRLAKLGIAASVRPARVCPWSNSSRIRAKASWRPA